MFDVTKVHYEYKFTKIWYFASVMERKTIRGDWKHRLCKDRLGLKTGFASKTVTNNLTSASPDFVILKES